MHTDLVDETPDVAQKSIVTLNRRQDLRGLSQPAFWGSDQVNLRPAFELQQPYTFHKGTHLNLTGGWNDGATRKNRMPQTR